MQFFIKTFGCQSNVYDSERIADIMVKAGYTKVEEYNKADLIILNTCHIREKADQKVFSEIGRYKIVKQHRKHVQIIVTGCVAQAYGNKLLVYGADIVLGPQSYQELPRKIGSKAVLTTFAPEDKFDSLPESNTHHNKVSAFIAIQEGCNKFCTYCVVPYTRGPEFSRDANQIYTEAQRLIDSGVQQITLLGQNVNAYHDKNNIKLSDLIKQIIKLGAKRITYTSSHPSNVTEDLIQVHSMKEVLPHLHFAVQSGSNKILKSMNRSHTVENYIDTVLKLKQIRPEMTFSTDMIVGFPGETEEDFQMTLDLIHEVKFIQVYYFLYSPRKGTLAYRMQDDTSSEVKKARLQKLKEVLSLYQNQYNQSMINIQTEVLIENQKRINNQNYEYFGRNVHMQPVHIISPEQLQIGYIYNVKIINAFLRGFEAIAI